MVGQNCGPTPSSPLPLLKSLDSLDRLRDAYVHHRLCHGMAFLTSLQILKPTRYEQGRVEYCHQAPDTTIRSSNAFGIPIVVSPFFLTAYQGVVNSNSQRLSPERRSALARGMLNARRSERLPSGGDRVEFVCELSRCWVVNAVLGVVWRGRSRAQWRMRSLC